MTQLRFQEEERIIGQRRRARQPKRVKKQRSLDHFIGNREHPGRYLDPKRSRSLKIDRELELG
jgi:hypothetical protein